MSEYQDYTLKHLQGTLYQILDNLEIRKQKMLEEIHKTNQLINEIQNEIQNVDSIIQLKENKENDSEEENEDEFEEEEDDEYDVSNIVTRMDPALAKLVGLNIKEEETKTDWKPPSFSGLNNSERISDKNDFDHFYNK